MNFEFSFRWIKPEGGHPDIKVFPMKGIVPGKGNAEIDIEYSPTVPVTVRAEVELNVSQFGLPPIIVVIMGSGRYPQLENQQKLKEVAQQKEEELEKKRQQKFVFRIRRHRGRRMSQGLSKKKDHDGLNHSQDIEVKPDEDINADQAPDSEHPGAPSSPGLPQSGKGLLPEGSVSQTRGSAAKRAHSAGAKVKGKIALEKAFLARFDAIAKMCKEKEIKMNRCVGDPEPTDLEKQALLDERRQFEQDALNKLREDGITRYQKALDEDLPIYEPILPYYPPTWDTGKNNVNKLRNMRLRKFMNAATRIVLRARIEKRFSRPAT